MISLQLRYGGVCSPPSNHLDWGQQTATTTNPKIPIPKCSMYGIFPYIWLKFMVNVGKYSIHGASGIYKIASNSFER